MNVMVPILKTVNKITTAIKSVNKLGLGAMAIVAIAMMSFKAPENKKLAPIYGKVAVSPSNPSGWQDLSGLTRQDEGPFDENTYRCEQADETCTAEFSTPPANHSSTPLVGSATEGDFIIND